jgi:acetyltransferase-like isoleucine patch superfamily enzyme
MRIYFGYCWPRHYGIFIRRGGNAMQQLPAIERWGRLASLNTLSFLRTIIVRAKWTYLTKLWGMDIDPTATFSLSASFDRTYPKGVHIGRESYIALGATILTHDTTRRLYCDTYVGKWCFIGARSLILPGVTIGDGSIVAAGAVVTKDVPPACIAAGNPAVIIRREIRVGPFGRFEQG